MAKNPVEVPAKADADPAAVVAVTETVADESQPGVSEEAAAVTEDQPVIELAPGQILVRFVQSHEVQDERRGTRFATIYAAGQEYALSEASAMHFVSRGKAVTV